MECKNKCPFVYFLIFNSQFLIFNSVSEAEPRHDVFAVWPDLFAQAGEVYIYGAVEHIYFVFPYPGKDFLALEHFTFVLKKEVQYLEFLFGERDFLSVYGGFYALRVE